MSTRLYERRRGRGAVLIKLTIIWFAEGIAGMKVASELQQQAGDLVRRWVAELKQVDGGADNWRSICPRSRFVSDWASITAN